MLLVWAIRLVILLVGFKIHWALGLLLIVSLIGHMNMKAKIYNEKYNLGGNIRSLSGKRIRAPWYLF